MTLRQKVFFGAQVYDLRSKMWYNKMLDFTFCRIVF